MKHSFRFVIGGTVVAACIAFGAQSNAYAQVTNSNTSSASSEKGKAQLSLRDSAYLRRSAGANLLEAKIGQLASEKGSTPEVKAWGQKVAQERQQAYQELTRLAQAKGLKIPTTLDTRHQKSLDRLTTLNGPDFDRAVLQHSVKANEAIVRSTEAESKSGKDQEIKQYATSALPTLQADLKQTKTLVAKARNATHEPAGAQK